jgi:hypothetical protein
MEDFEQAIVEAMAKTMAETIDQAIIQQISEGIDQEMTRRLSDLPISTSLDAADNFGVNDFPLSAVGPIGPADFIVNNNSSVYMRNDSVVTRLDTSDMDELKNTVALLQREMLELKRQLSNTTNQKDLQEHRKLTL